MIAGTFRRVLLACAIWIGFIPLIPVLDNLIFNAEFNLAQGDFIARYARVAQQFFMEQLAVTALLVGAGLWISTRLVPAYREKVVSSVLFGSFLTAVSIFNVNHVVEPSYEAYLRGFPLFWVSYVNSIGSFDMWILVINVSLIVDVLFWAIISYLVMFVAMKLVKGRIRLQARKVNE